tara:strand:- start:125 stop:655 length:531 start_codon:yes stop_codon:yes gene_type:complete
MSRDDDRSKKSFSELDKMRQNNRHGGDQQRGPGKLERTRAYKDYKTQLNKLFDGGGELPEALKSKLEDSGVAEAAKERQEAAEKVLEAMSPRKLRKAFKAYRAEHGFPDDERMLNKLLESDDEDLLVEVLDTMDRLLSEGLFKGGPALKARIESAQILVDDPAVKKAGDQLIAKIR